MSRLLRRTLIVYERAAPVYGPFDMINEPTLYDLVPYNCAAHPVTAPQHLALVGRLNGGPEPPLRGYRMLELGCGDGSNLLPLAFHQPESTFVGLDASTVQIEMGRVAIERLGLRNVRLDVADVRALPDLGGPFDYIVSHGVFSWVPEDARTAILAAASGQLAAHGLAYISYNALPGWKIRGIAREIVMESVKGERDPKLRAAKAQAAAAEVAAMILSVDHPYRALLKRELGYVVESDLPYVLHEYLSEENIAFYVRDFLSLAERHGLRHVGDALIRSVPATLPPAAKTRLGEGIWGVEGHQLSDILHNRQFRASVLCHAGAELRDRATEDIVRRSFIAAKLTSVSGEVRLDPGVEETFKGQKGVEVTAKDPLLKASLWVLRERFPAHLAFDALVAEVSALLAARSIQRDPKPDQIDKLARGLFTLYLNDHADLRVDGPRVRVKPGERPALTPLARYELTKGGMLTTPLHIPMVLDEVERRVAQRLDGSATFADLAPEIALHAAAGDPPITIDGAPITDPLILTPMVEVMVQKIVDKLSAWGLLEDVGARS